MDSAVEAVMLDSSTVGKFYSRTKLDVFVFRYPFLIVVFFGRRKLFRLLSQLSF